MSVFRRVRRRDRLFIMAQVLDIAQEPNLKTQIMYKASLSFAQLNEYLSMLLDLGLLEAIKDEKGERTAYKTTSKGLRYLEVFNETRKLANKEQVVKHKRGS